MKVAGRADDGRYTLCEIKPSAVNGSSMGALASYYNTMRTTLLGARTSRQPCAKRELAAQASSRALRTSDNGSVSVIPPLASAILCL